MGLLVQASVTMMTGHEETRKASNDENKWQCHAVENIVCKPNTHIENVRLQKSFEETVSGWCEDGVGVHADEKITESSVKRMLKL